MSGAIFKFSKREKIIALIIGILFLLGTIYNFWSAYSSFADSGILGGILFLIGGIITLVIALIIGVIALMASS